jgi:hypothetical protein
MVSPTAPLAGKRNSNWSLGGDRKVAPRKGWLIGVGVGRARGGEASLARGELSGGGRRRCR